MTDEGGVSLERRAPLGWITLERPTELNTLAGDMRERLRRAIVEAARDDDVEALVITGAGDSFCAGGDTGTMARLHEEDDHAGFHDVLHAGAEVVLALQAFPGLSVAAIRGVAAGAGLALALNCDLRIATEDARLAASWGRIALAPDWGATFWLPRLLGYSRALKLILGAETLQARDALELGLLHEVVADDELEERATAVATELGRPAETVRQVKYLLRKGIEGSLEGSLAAETEVQEDLFESEEVAAGLRAFLESRRAGPADG